MADAAERSKWVPYLGKSVTVYEEGGRLLRANGMVETSNVMAAATVNYIADAGVTRGGAWVGSVAGAEIGSFIYPGIGTIVGADIGGVYGAYKGHLVYDVSYAPDVRVKFAGEKFRE